MRKTKERKRIRPPDLAAVERVEPPTCPPTAEIRTRRARNLRIDRFLKSSPSRHLGQKLQIKNKTRNCMLDHLSPVFLNIFITFISPLRIPSQFFYSSSSTMLPCFFNTFLVQLYKCLFFHIFRVPKKAISSPFFPKQFQIEKKNHFLVYPLHS